MTACLATYVHDLSPFLLPIKGNFGVRWYGFMYVIGFLAAFFLLRWFVRLRCCELKEDKVADFITVIAIFGVMVGGRLGFMLLYNTDAFFRNPLIFFNFLGGGMSSHGGILGTTLVVYFFARWQKISWLGLGDNLVITGPLGVFFGRIGNFINGELYGRITTHRWGMKFPDELHQRQPRELVLAAEQAGDIAPGMAEKAREIVSSSGYPVFDVAEMMIETSRKNEAFRQFLGEAVVNGQPLLHLRHPSQIYQALCEGLLVFLVLLAVRLRWKNAYHGVISGLFFILYAIARIAVENVRQPDSGLNMIAGMTRGQFYSVFFFAIGAAFLIYAFTVRRQNEIPPASGNG